MHGLVLTLLVSATPAQASASATCADEPASCDAAGLTQAAGDDDDDGGDLVELPRRYATPAVIDCRLPAVPAVMQTLVGECDGTPRDTYYRASRDPESEQSGRTLVAAPQDRDPRHGPPACHGVPPEGVDLPLSPAQPLALFALPDLVLAAADAQPPAQAFLLPSRTTDPPERPPRA
jgi:hypothetical protein